MIVSYRDERTRDFVSGKRVKTFSGIERALHDSSLIAWKQLRDLGALPGNRLEALKGDRKGQYSIRINDQWRIVSSGLADHQACKTWRLLITIRGEVVTIHAMHPGEHLSVELKELGMSAAELARQLDVPTNRLTEILNGRRAITGDTALRLAHFFGTTAEKLTLNSCMKTQQISC